MFQEEDEYEDGDWNDMVHFLTEWTNRMFNQHKVQGV